jgi:hypothetical protein
MMYFYQVVSIKNQMLGCPEMKLPTTAVGTTCTKGPALRRRF